MPGKGVISEPVKKAHTIARKTQKQRFLSEVNVVPAENSILNIANPDSLINKVPDAIANLLPDVVKHYDRILASPEDIATFHYKPNERDERIKIQFWDEYNISCAQKRRMAISNIIRGVMFYDNFYRYFCKLGPRLAWLLVPPRDYTLTMQAILNKGLTRLDEIMSMKMVDDKGKPDHRIITQILRVFQIVDNRTKGSIIQRVQIQQQIQQHSIVATATTPLASLEDAKKTLSTMSMEEIAEMERKVKALEHHEAIRIGHARSLAGENPYVGVALEKYDERDGEKCPYAGELLDDPKLDAIEAEELQAYDDVRANKEMNVDVKANKDRFK